jgi:hypothetical protein
VEGFQIENLLEGLLVAATIVFIAYSPIARAIANRILHGRLPPPGAPPLDDPRMDQISGEVQVMRRHLDETLERLDFAERMLAQSREKNALPGKS